MPELLTEIAIVGAGNLGRRHLQSLVQLKSPRNFYIIDPFEKSLLEAENLVRAADKNAIHKYSFAKETDHLPMQLDFAVLATSSNERFTVLSQLLNMRKVRFLLIEKVLFPRLGEYNAARDLLLKNGVTAWVNCPRRMFPLFQEMRNYFIDNGPTIFSATGNMWQLGCNGIHAYDAFAFLTGDTDIQFKTDLLDPEVLSSKRSGYIEFTGSIYGSSHKGNFIQLTSNANNVARMPAVYSIANADAHFILHGGAEAHYQYALATDNWEWKRRPIKYPFQSELTQLIVRQIEDDVEPGLTPFDESAKLHKQLINAFILHLDREGFVHTEGECLIS